ncbi:hypothetical protein Poli38472_000164 [Pythium oligandrum]|uniref:PIPK domain-containing protein n=1 Tax=Pythium oligandrum TaxID=41045 RepID=A0A8K1FHU5_PYTOL|nr:hypothetical protein Poli38472_000164 [Pythium oligandrum]|eukprot:TMW60122.1 hypothetical protein Poli38472_000164 [Pythium oligandrum]
MDLHIFRRNPEVLCSTGSTRSSSPRLRVPADEAPEPETVISPRPFHGLVTPSPSAFSIFSRIHSPYQPDDQIVEVDEASGYGTHGRRYSSNMGSPITSPTSVPRHSTTKQFRDPRRRSSLQITTSLRATEKRREPLWFALGFGWRPHRSLLRRIYFWFGAIGLFLFCFALIFVLPQELQRLAPNVIGSLLSFISSLTILVSYLFQPQNRRYPNELLVYVAICEFGLALLALVHVMVFCADSTTCEPMGFQSCSIMTALEMFLLIASVGWFGCAILHLFVSVSNPFANYKSQLKRYHLLVWGGSTILTLIIPLVMFSSSIQTRYEMSGAEICRAVGLSFPMLPSFTTDDERNRRISQWQVLNLGYWGSLFTLVVTMVIAAQFILAVGWWRSNSGTVIALRARRRMMKRMTTYVHTLNATWLVILVVFFTYRSNESTLDHLAAVSSASSASWNAAHAETSDVQIDLLDAIFHFVLAAKGYFTCVVWVAVNRHCCAFGPTLRGDVQRGSESGNCSSDEEEDEEEGNQPASRLTLISASAASQVRGPPRSLGITPRLPLTSPRFPGTPTPLHSLVSSSASQNNETLQREIIYYTVCGITKSILRSAQNPDTDVFFQQLMVGADRESAAQNESFISRAQSMGEYMSSPRAYCFASSHSSSFSTSVGPSVSFSAAQGARDDASERLDDSISSLASSSHSYANSTVSIPTPSTSVSNQHRSTFQRYSMYPVSHVPFELFEEEIELQSHGSPEEPLSLSPIFANLRRTATALYNHPKGRGIENPRPKMFIDYAPTEFRAIRKAFGISDENYLASFRSTAKERVSAGSSGAFMFFSGDNALIVKSMKERECRKLAKMIPAYADYITCNPKSRIIRFFGCHRIRLYGRNFYFVVTSNVLHSNGHTATITEKYDVKGSWIDRQAKLPQPGDLVTCSQCNATYEYGREDASTSFPFHVHRPDTILKDMDMKRPLHMNKGMARELYDQLVMDSEFLNAMGIMDYSLLIGVHKCSLQEAPWQREFRTSMSFLANSGEFHDSSSGQSTPKCGCHLEPIPEDDEHPEEMYFVGIIDILQEWNWEKQLEQVGKMLIGKSSSGISAVAPDTYCERFKSRMAQILQITEQDSTYNRLRKQVSAPPILSRYPENMEFHVVVEESVEDSEEERDVLEEAESSEEDELDAVLEFDAEVQAVSFDLDAGPPLV